MIQNEPELNIELKKSIFHDKEAESILAMPFSTLNITDKQIWRFTPTGTHSVWSAYHLYKQMKAKDWCSTSSGQQSKLLWQSIWGLLATNGVKVFIRRACKEIWPTCRNLCKRKIVEQSICPIYLTEEEIAAHVIRNCPAAQDTWTQASPKIQKIAFHSQAFIEVWDYLREKLTHQELSAAAFIFKLLWFRMCNTRTC